MAKKQPKITLKYVRRPSGWVHLVAFVNGRRVSSLPVYRYRDYKRRSR